MGEAFKSGWEGNIINCRMKNAKCKIKSKIKIFLKFAF